MSLLVEPCAGIAALQPCRTYYQLLDISPEEQNSKVIEEAAFRCSGHVRLYQLKHESECTLRLNEIAQALITLLDPVRRREYDLSLGKPLSPQPSERRPPEKPNTPVLPRGKSALPTLPDSTPRHVISDEGACDVKLVFRK
jgi:hypothetical protein